MRVKNLIRRSVATAVSKLPIGILTGREHADIFQKAGFHITKDHFYEPIPNTSEIDPGIWDRPSELIGVKTNIDQSVEFLRDASASGYVDEFHRFPLRQSFPDQYERLGSFGGLDGAFYYFALRKFKPSRVIEIGAGQSTLLSRFALEENGKPWTLKAIDPYPPAYLRDIDDARFDLIEGRVERAPLSLFETLRANDILFIDSSHVIRIGGDVLYEVLEILPRLAVGTVIYIHDIFMPNHYPKEWTMLDRRFWTEQYLMQAFLAFNDSFDITFSAALVLANHPSELASRFPDWRGPGSVPSGLIIRRAR